MSCAELTSRFYSQLSRLNWRLLRPVAAAPAHLYFMSGRRLSAAGVIAGWDDRAKPTVMTVSQNIIFLSDTHTGIVTL
jgi:hypothetical protein